MKIDGRTIAGKGLILSHNDEGESVATNLTSEDVFKKVEFLPEGHTEEPSMHFTII